MLLFFVGIIEMIIVALWTKYVVEAKVLASGAISMINVLIWYYVLETITRDISNIKIVLIYAAGCAVGTMLGSLIKVGSKEKQALSGSEVASLITE